MYYKYMSPLEDITAESINFGSKKYQPRSSFLDAGLNEYDPLAIDFDGAFSKQSGSQKDKSSGLMGDIGLAIDGLNTMGNLWGAFQAQKLAKRAFRFERDFANTNLANSIKSYNTSLSDRAQSRFAFEGRSPEEAQAYIDQNKLKDRTIT